ncbi:ATP-binding protein [Spirochaeta dissipatitropha]
MYPRNQFESLYEQADARSISILIGSRQVGKSTLMQLLRERISQPSEWYNLENPLHLALFEQGYTSFIRQVKTNLLFIDEFQYCRNISSVFKAIYDLNPDIKIFASGSSSLDIQSHLKESLAGRKRQHIIYPLSLSEWLGGTSPELARISSIDTTDPVDQAEAYRQKLDMFIRYGGLPGISSSDSDLEKREYLFGIYETYIAKDIKSFLNEESILSFNTMMRWLALHNGSMLQKASLSRTSGVSTRQIDKYLEILGGTFVLSQVLPLYNNKGKELTKTSKYYLYDQGIINSIIQDFRPAQLRTDIGTLHEQLVYWELKKQMDIRFQLKYWRTSDGKEVDFILEKDRQLLPIEVKTSWSAGKIPKGLRAFLALYPEVRQAVVLYNGAEHSVMYEDCTIWFAPHYKASRVLELLL